MKRLTIMTALLVVAASCGTSEDAATQRQIDLEPTAALPAGEASLTGGVLEVHATGLEPLVDAHHVVWVEDSEGNVHNMGPLQSGELSTEAPEASEGWHCFVTEEDAEDVEFPSSRHRLDGSIGGPMHFDENFSEDSLREATGDCMLADYDVDLGVEGLPDAPDGLRYTGWAVCPHLEGHHHDDEPADATGTHDEDDGHQDEEDGHHNGEDGHDDAMTGDDVDHHDDPEETHHHYFEDHDDSEGTDEPVRLGALDGETLHMRHHDRVGGCESVFITLESMHGVDDPSPIVVMHGDVEFPARDENEVHMH